MVRVNVNQDNGFTWLFLSGVWGLTVIQSQHPEGALRGDLGHPIICNAKSTARMLQETYLSQWRGCTRCEATHTYFSRKLFLGGNGGFWRLTVRFYSFIYFLHEWNTTPKSMKLKYLKMNAKWDQIQFKPLPTHALFTSGHTMLSIRYLTQAVW